MNLIFFTLNQDLAFWIYVGGLAVFGLGWLISILDDTPVSLWKTWKSYEAERETYRRQSDKYLYQRACERSQKAARAFIKSIVSLFYVFIWPVALVLGVIYVLALGVKAVVAVVKNGGGILAAANGKFND